MSTLIRYEAGKKPVRRPTEQQLRQEIIQVCRLLHQKDYCLATDGNVSARLDTERFLVTPSGYSKALVQATQLVTVDASGQVVGQGKYGPQRGLRPSSEILLHLEAYRQRPDVQAVVHAHPPVAIALSIAGYDVAPCLLPDVILFFGMVPTTEYATPASAEGAKVITDLITRYDALVLQRHGSVTVGSSVVEAYLRLEKLEQAALITKTVIELGRARPFPPDEVDKLAQWRSQQGLNRPSQDEEIRGACGVCSAAGSSGCLFPQTR